MNKYQEAFKKLLNTDTAYTHAITHEFMLLKDINELFKECVVIQELVDRATPKRVIIHNGALRQLGSCECPHCHRVMFSTQYQGKIHFCPHKDCGQSLEWEKGEKK